MNLLNVIRFGSDILHDELFGDISLPVTLDRDKVIQTIIYKNWDLTPKITDFNLLKSMITNFFSIKYNNYEKIVRALTEEYNPVHNYDRFEDRAEKRVGNKSDHLKSTGTDENESKVSAFDSSSYQPQSLDTNTRDLNDERKTMEDETYQTKNHLYGNIGVTTSQQMLESEIKLRLENNIYELISLDFRREFMLLLL